MPTINSSTARKGAAHGRKEILVEDGQRGGPYQRVTIDMLPGDVLLEIFDIYVDEHWRVDGWYTLIHVCRRWRQVVFESPHRLNLRVRCTHNTPVERMLDIWPPFPIAIQDSREVWQQGDYSNIEAALKYYDRVCEITIDSIQSTFLKKIAEMEEPFTALTDLHLSFDGVGTEAEVPDLLLVGSAPCLRTLVLDGIRIPFPRLPELLLSVHDLVVLDLVNIPCSGDISPAMMVTCLTSLTRLESFNLAYSRPHQYWIWRPNRSPPAHTYTVLHSLTSLRLTVFGEFLDGFLSRIDVPQIYSVHIELLDPQILGIPSLRHFISRTEAISTPHRANIWFIDSFLYVTLWQEGMVDDRDAMLSIAYSQRSKCQLPSAARFCNLYLPPLPTVEHLDIFGHSGLYEVALWVEVLHPFASAKNLYLNEQVVPYVAPALQLPVEREVLPILRNIFVDQCQSPGSVLEAFAQLVAARQLLGLPIAFYHRNGKWEEWQRVDY